MPDEKATQQQDIQNDIDRLIGLSGSKKRHYAAMKKAVRDLEKMTDNLRGSASALKVAEARYRAMFEHAGTAVIVFEQIENSDDFLIKEFNRFAELTEGVSRDDLLGDPVSTAMPGFTACGLLDVIRNVHHTGETQRFPTTFCEGAQRPGWRQGHLYRLPSSEVVFIYQDVSERKHSEDALRIRERYLECLANIATEALQSDSLDQALPHMLGHLGRTTNLRRVMLLENHTDQDGNLLANIRHEWIADEMPSILGHPGARNVDYAEQGLTFLTGQLDSHQHVTVNVADMPPNEQPGLLSLGIQSMLAIPLFVAGEWHGAIVFCSSVPDHHWPAQEISLLETAASTVSQTIERRIAQRELRRSQFSLNHTPDAMYWVAYDGKILLMNAAARRQLGYPPGDLGGANVFDFTPNHTLETHQANWEILREQGTVSTVDVLRAKDGHLFPAEITVSYLDFEGTAYALFVARDITERQQTEAKLHESEARLQYLTSQFPVAIWSADTDLRVTYHSGALTKETANVFEGGEIDRIYMTDIVGSVYGPDLAAKRLEQLRQVLAGKTTRYVHYSGEHCFENVVSPLRDGNGEIIGVVGLAIDATDRRRLEERANQSQRLEALGKLAGGVAHDFNNLLTGILGNLSLASLDVSPEVLPMINDADKAARRASALTRQLLTFARRSPTDMKNLDLNLVIRDATSLIRETVDRRIDIIVDLQEDLPQIRGDDTQLNQVIMNLLVNARDAIADCLTGKAYPERRNDPFIITVTTQEVVIDRSEELLDDSVHAGRHILLSISDNGAGMDAETRKHIFEPFFTTKTEGKKGTGLGLATVHGILTQHDGWVNVYSDPGRGTTFRIYLPPASGDTPTEVEEESEQVVAGGSETILVADDEELVLTLCQRILAGYGYNVLTVDDGHQAVTTFMQHADEIDLVILDLSMPVLSGKEAMEQLQALDPETRIIIASGYSSDSQIDELMRNGARAYVQKPYHVSDLAGTVRSILDAK